MTVNNFETVKALATLRYNFVESENLVIVLFIQKKTQPTLLRKGTRQCPCEDPVFWTPEF